MVKNERRRNTRVAFHTSADLRFPHDAYSQRQTRNLSVSSIFILGIINKNLGDKCDVTLHLTGATSDLRINIKGEVVRCEPDGIALRFYEIDLDSFYHLKNIIYYNIENPDEFDEEFPGYIPHPSID